MSSAIITLVKITLLTLIFSAIPLLSEAYMPIWILISFNAWLLRFNVEYPAKYAFFVGLLFDVLYSDLLGQHALALTLSTIIIIKNKNSFSFTNTTTEQVYIALTSIVYLVTIYIIHSIHVGSLYQDWWLLISPLTTALCWPIVKWLVKYLSRSYDTK